MFKKVKYWWLEIVELFKYELFPKSRAELEDEIKLKNIKFNFAMADRDWLFEENNKISEQIDHYKKQLELEKSHSYGLHEKQDLLLKRIDELETDIIQANNSLKLQDQRILDLITNHNIKVITLEKQISDLKCNPESISPYIRHLLKVTSPGETKYDDDDFEDSERTFYSEANDVAKNDAFKIIIGRMSQAELENTFIQGATTTDLSKFGMTRPERIAFGEGSLHGIALIKEEIDRLSNIYVERLQGSKPLTNEEKFETA